MKIVQLQAENIKRLHAVNITPDGAMVEITGRNGEGKSSVLDAIAYGLAGKDAIPACPVRKGETKAKIIVDLGDIIVTRQWNKSGNTSLVVESKDGSRFPSPQKLLDKLSGRLTFDPMGFLRMSPRDQASTLRSVAGLDFAAQDARRAEAYEERTALNRSAKASEAQLSAIPVVDAPGAEVGLSDLLGKQAEALVLKQGNDEIRASLSSATSDVDRIERALHDARRVVAGLDADKLTAHDAKATCENRVAKLTDPDMDKLASELMEGESSNELFRVAQKRAELAASLDELKGQADALTKEMADIDSAKDEAVRDAALPFDGLGFDASGVTLGGIPLEQASSAEQLRASVAMGVALNPKLRIMLIRDGSLLDSESLALLGSMAEQHDVQVWVERVTDGESVGVVIEDGYVRE